MNRSLAVAGALVGATGGFALATHQAARRAERERPAPGRFLSAGGLRLHLTDQGEGPPVVVLHGNGSMVEEMHSSGLPALLAERHRVVVLDRPGFGRSERPRGHARTPEAQAAVIAEAIGRLGLDRPVVIGHSFGTLVALALALDHPGLVRSLVLLGGYYFPTARADVPLFSTYAVPAVGDALRYTVGPPLGRATAWPVIRRIFAPLPVSPRFAAEYPLPLALRPWQLRALAEDTAAMVPAAARQSARHAELRLPVAIVAGEADRIVTTARQSARLHAALPGSRFLVIQGAGHMVHHAAPRLVAEAVTRLAA